MARDVKGVWHCCCRSSIVLCGLVYSYNSILMFFVLYVSFCELTFNIIRVFKHFKYISNIKQHYLHVKMQHVLRACSV